MGNNSEMAVQRSEGGGTHLLQPIQTIFKPENSFRMTHVSGNRS